MKFRLKNFDFCRKHTNTTLMIITLDHSLPRIVTIIILVYCRKEFNVTGPRSALEEVKA